VHLKEIGGGKTYSQLSAESLAQPTNTTLAEGQGRMKIETIGMGELLGWSWLFPPYRWAFRAVATSPVEAFEFDAATVRACCASDPGLGYELTRRLARLVAKRLQATRLRLMTASSQPAGLP
jgi:CRP-like cAMP-binding protein